MHYTNNEHKKCYTAILDFLFNREMQIPAGLCCPLLGPDTCLQPGIQLLGQPALSAQLQVTQREERAC